ncbi:MAG: hypothetical protein Q7U04_09170, partial [Bacteriovorax sp.]|nr:hypothetical protein [Bacteriovorax sp.]
TKMKKLIDQQKMRKDFYYRLTSGVVLELNSLRDNPNMIKELCRDFENQKCIIISDELINYYLECPWLGNIRQLLSHLNKKKILSQNKKLILDHLDHDLLNDKAEISGFKDHQLRPLEEIKMDYCLSVFMKMNNNFARAAKLLDISPNTLKALLANREKLRNLRDHQVVDINL